MDQANDLYFKERYLESIPLFEKALETANELSPSERSQLFFRRGFTYGERGGDGDWDLAIQDYTQVIQMEGAPIDQVAKALVNRGFTYRERGGDGDRELEIQDYTQVIQMEGAPIDQVEKAKRNIKIASS